jgi:hypothetical protein
MLMWVLLRLEYQNGEHLWNIYNTADRYMQKHDPLYKYQRLRTIQMIIFHPFA